MLGEIFGYISQNNILLLRNICGKTNRMISSYITNYQILCNDKIPIQYDYTRLETKLRDRIELMIGYNMIITLIDFINDFKIIDNGSDVDVFHFKNAIKEYVLNITCKYGHINIFNMLPFNSVKLLNESLKIVTESKHIKLMIMMFELGADDYIDAFIGAINRKHNKKIFNYLIKYKSYMDLDRCLEQACMYNNLHAMKILLNNGAKYCGWCYNNIVYHWKIVKNKTKTNTAFTYDPVSGETNLITCY
jgi:hypothetical protein